MKILFSFFILIVAALTTQSCKDNISVEMPVGRTYETDVTVLNKFVDIHKTTYVYYVNPNKRSTVLSYIDNSDSEEINAVSSANLSRFKDELDRLNTAIGQSASSHTVDYIVMATNSETYISKINNHSPIDLSKVAIDSRSDFNIQASLNVAADVQKQVFRTGNDINTKIEMNPAIYRKGCWSFYLTCEAGEGEDKSSADVLISGTGYFNNANFNWYSNTSDGRNQKWSFAGEGMSSDVNVSYTARIDFYNK